jgi:hypothetical protein
MVKQPHTSTRIDLDQFLLRQGTKGGADGGATHLKESAQAAFAGQEFLPHAIGYGLPEGRRGLRSQSRPSGELKLSGLPGHGRGW